VALIVLVVVLLLFEGFFSGSETALTSAGRATIHSRARNGDPSAQRVEGLLRHPERFLGMTLVGTNIAVVSASTIAEKLLAPHVPDAWETYVNAIVMAPVILLFAELLPKSLARGHADAWALRFSVPLAFAARVLAPVAFCAGKLSGLLSGLFLRSSAGGDARHMTRDDLQTVAEIAIEEGILPEPTGPMLRRVFELDGKPVSSIMVPLVDVEVLSQEATVQEAENLSVRTGLTRFPVYSDRIDNIIGVLDIRSVLYARAGLENRSEAHAALALSTIRAHMSCDVAFVPETKAVGELLHEVRYQKLPLTVVVDEHGGVVGMVTEEDLIEALVGDIRDERDRDGHAVRQTGTATYECAGKLSIDDLVAELGIDIDKAGFETVAGLVLKVAGCIPAVGDKVRFADYEIEVLEVRRRHPARVRFTVVTDQQLQ